MPMQRTDASVGRSTPDRAGPGPPQLQSWWDLSDEMFALVDSDGHFRSVNPAWQRTLGHRVEELLGSSPLDLLHREDVLAGAKAIQEVWSAGGFDPVALRCRHAQGGYRWLLWSGNLDTSGCCLTARDVTAWRDSEGELAQRERRSRALLAALRDGVWVVDGEGRITEVNECFCEMTGFTAEELMGTAPPRPFWPPESIDVNSQAFHASLQGDRGHYELTFMRKGGERFPVTIEASALGEDEPGFLCVVRDVSHEEGERERLHDAHAVARLISWEWDPSDDSIALSSGLIDLTGLEVPDDPKLAGLMTLVPEPYASELMDAFARVLEGRQEDVVLESPWEVPNPEIRWVETRGRPVHDADGHVVRLRGITQDITARKEAELALQRSEDRLAQAQRVSRIGSFEIDYRDGSTQWSSELYRLYGIEGEPEITVEEARAMLPPEDRRRVIAATATAVDDGSPQELEHRYMRGSETRWSNTRLEALEDKTGRYGVRGTLQDITESKLAEQRVHLQAHLLDAVDVAVIATGLDGLITNWNAGAERMYGWTRDETIGHPLRELVVPPEHEAKITEVMRRVRETGQWKGELDTRRRDGSAVPSYLEVTAFSDLDGQPAGIVGVAVDITERAEAERQVRSARDYLHTITNSMGEGLLTMDTEGRLIYLNRAGERLLGWHQEELAGRDVHEATHYRHPDGTDYPIAECPLRAACREGESVRLDDEVFIRKDGTEMPVEIVAEPFETEGGVRGSVVVFGDITERRARERRVRGDLESLVWVGRVRDALAEDRFVLYAQPIVEVATGTTVQHELLLRMLGDDGEVIAPGEFLAAAEEYGLIEEVDRWVVREAIALAAQGHAVELNLSARSMSAPRLVDDFRSELERTGADPSLLVVELTETALLEDERAGELFLQRIRALGCAVALDDFGTGYGGFRYLKRLPVDYLKIDIEFVRDLPTNVASQHVVSAVVSLAKGFGQRTVAEGVEDEETLAMLRDLGVDYAQGYLIARPRPVPDVLGVPG